MLFGFFDGLFLRILRICLGFLRGIFFRVSSCSSSFFLIGWFWVGCVIGCCFGIFGCVVWLCILGVGLWVCWDGLWCCRFCVGFVVRRLFECGLGVI